MSAALFFLITISSAFASSSSSPLVFRAGEQGRFWYAVLGGSLEVRYHAHSDADGKVSALTHQYNREIYIHICLCQLLSSTMA